MSGSGLISRRAFASGVLSRLARRQGIGAGLCRARRKRRGFCRRRSRQDIFVSGRSRPASGIPHRVVVRDRQPRPTPTAPPMARNGRCSGRRRSRARSRKAGPISSSGWAMPRSPAPTRIAPAKPLRAAASARPALTPIRFSPGSMPGRCAGLMRINATNIAPLELKASGADFSYALRLDADRPLVLQGDAGYSRKSLREQASYYYSQPHYQAKGSITIDDKTARCDRAGLARSRMEQPAAGVRPDRMGLAVAAFQRGRKADAVPDAPDRRPSLRLRQMDRAATATPSSSLQPTSASRRRPSPRSPAARSRPLAHRDSRARPDDRLHAAQSRRAGWERVFPIGKARSALRGSHSRIRLSGDDGVLEALVMPGLVPAHPRLCFT